MPGSILRVEYGFIFLTLVMIMLMFLQRGRNADRGILLRFSCLVAVSIVHFILDYLSNWLEYGQGTAAWVNLLTHVNYALRPFLLLLVLLISERRRPFRYRMLLWLPMLVLTGILTVSYPFGWVAGRREVGNGFVDGPLLPVTWLTLVVYMVLILHSAATVRSSREESAFLLLGESFIACNIIYERVYSMTIPGMGHMVIALAILVYFLYFCSHSEARYREEKEKELSQARVQAMISQIKPHFIYNSLACIAEITHDDAAQGEEAILTFSSYLRSCFQSLTEDGMIPFADELEMIRQYVALERMQDPEKLTVVYDIQEEHFLVPAVSVETLVENAVKHGVRKKRSGGTVTLRTVRDSRGIVITVADDGAGFEQDVDSAGVGMKNAQLRLKEQCGADMCVVSHPGQGTEITIVLQEMRKNDDPDS